MKKIFITGEPSYEESNFLWKYKASEPDVTHNEYMEAYRSLHKHILYWLPDYRKDRKKEYCYVRGDNYGDRTQYVDIGLPELLNFKFFSYLQKWISLYNKKADVTWRIFIPTYIGDAETIFLYENKIAFGRKYNDWQLNDILNYIIVHMRKEAEEQGYLNVPDTNRGVTEPAGGTDKPSEAGR